MVRGTPQIGVQAIHPLLAGLLQAGVDLESFLAPFDLTAEQVADPDLRIPLAVLDPMWQRASERTGDGDFGLHAAEAVQAGSFGILSYLGVTSPTWRAGLDQVCKYFQIFSDASGYEVRADEHAVHAIAFHRIATPDPVRHRVEFSVAVLAGYGRSFVDGDWAVDDVYFEHAAPAGLREHARLFGRAPRFGAAESGFRFAPALLDRPLRTRDPGLHRILQRQADQILATMAPVPTLSAVVRTAILRTGFGADLALDAVAHRMAMSARTLQRRLREEGTTLARLVDEARRATAVQLLARRELAVSEVAFALGFSEPAAFHHAFKRWTGVTPAEYRRAAATRG